MREPVTIHARASMTEARKRRIHTRENGVCWFCDGPVEVAGPTVRYDHKLPLELGGSDDDANIFPLHTEPCDRLKTARDVRRITKAKRLQRKLTSPRPTGSIRGRGFGTHPTMKRTVGGRVVARTTPSTGALQ